MLSKFTFEKKVAAVIIAVLALVGTISLLTYQSLRQIANKVWEVNKPNTRMSMLKQLQIDLSDAENSVRSYNITHDVSYLGPFYNSISMVDERIAGLQQQNWVSPAQGRLMDSISQLVEEKYRILDQLLTLETNASVTEELAVISKKIDQAERRQKASSKKIPEKKTNIFKKIFGRKDTVVVAQAAPPPAINLKDVKKEIAKVRDEQERQQRDMKQKELTLTRDSKLVMDKIQVLVNKMEAYEKSAVTRDTKKIALSANQSKLLIVAFAFAATVLLLTVAYLTISYVQKNRAYRVALRKAKTEAENLAKAKENFLANMSHEIRTPINAIAGFTEQILQTRLDEQQHDQLTVVKKSADHLLRIVNDILDYSKMQAGKFVFDNTGFNPREVVEETMTLIKPSAEAKGLTTSVFINENVPEVLLGDPLRLRQILLNILGNSVKFTERGGISIRVGSVPLENNKAALQISVMDTGTGIPEDKIKMIFSEFEQADTSVSRKYGGTGLGLTITKKLVEMQQGSIEITSAVDKGTKVTCTIPYMLGTKDSIVPEPVPVVPEQDFAGKRVLIVDDEEYNRLLANTIIKKWHMQVTSAVNGKEALNDIKANNYDIILMDLRMPGMDGIEVTKTIRRMADKSKAGTPILGITATVNQQELDQCMAAGMNDMLSKPFKEGELYSKLLKMLNAEPVATVSEPQPEVSAAEGEGKTFSLEELRHLGNGDEEFVEEMVNIFIRTTRNGLQEIDAGIAAGDWEAVADSAHKIVSPCRHIHANTLLKLLKTIETDIRERNHTENVPRLLAEAKAEAAEVIEGLEEVLAHEHEHK